MKHAVAPGGKSLIFHGGVGPGGGLLGRERLGSWSVCGPHLELVLGWMGRGARGEGKETPLVVVFTRSATTRMVGAVLLGVLLGFIAAVLFWTWVCPPDPIDLLWE